MYFLMSGFVGIAFNSYQSQMFNSPFKIAHKQRGVQLICDHYVFNKRRSNFSYIVLQDCFGFALASDYVHNVIFQKYPDYSTQIKADSWSFYNVHIHKPFNNQRKEYIKELNSLNVNKNITVDHKVQDYLIPSVEQLKHMYLTRHHKNSESPEKAKQPKY